jgi:multidrug efflux pump subunit AcrB
MAYIIDCTDLLFSSLTPPVFQALIGVLALFGIVVNNSIIMVDKINKNLDLGLSVREAVVEGATSRLEPILLTAITTIVGLIPITLSDPIWQGLGGAIIAGLTFSGIAKLFFIPVIYEMWFDHKSDHDEHPQLTDDYRASFEAIK